LTKQRPSADAVQEQEVNMGSAWWEPVYCASSLSDGNINVSSAPATIDGVTPPNGRRILLTRQTTASQNTSWIYNGTGAALTATTDVPVAGAVVRVSDGATLAHAELCLNDVTTYRWTRQFSKTNVRDFGATGLGYTGFDAAVTTTTLTTTTTTFTPAAVPAGTPIAIVGAGTGGTTHVTTAVYAGPNTLTLAAAVATAVTNATFVVGPDDSVAIGTALASGGGGSVVFPPGVYVLGSGQTGITTGTNTAIEFEEGAVVAPFQQSLTIQGPVVASPMQKIFGLSERFDGSAEA
jgi:hypothetical protein